jgi:hypothetical protein
MTAPIAAAAMACEKMEGTVSLAQLSNYTLLADQRSRFPIGLGRLTSLPVSFEIFTRSNRLMVLPLEPHSQVPTRPIENGASGILTSTLSFVT